MTEQPACAGQPLMGCRTGCPGGHPAYFISDTVDGLDLRAFHARYASCREGLGQPS